MKTHFKPIYLATILFILLIISVKIEAASVQLHVKILPDESTIEGTINIDNPADSTFFLTKGLIVKQVKANGKEIEIEKEDNTISPYSFLYTLPALPKKLEIQYSGKIEAEDFPKAISSLNLLTSEAIELTDLIDWYPRFVHQGSFQYKLSVELPEKYGMVANAQFVSSKKNKSIWETEQPVNQISLIAAPGMKKSVASDSNFTVEINSCQLPEAYVDSMKTDLLQTLQFYSQLCGSKGSNQQVRIVYSPRGAGGYARSSLIVVSEKYAQEQAALPFGYARDFRLNAHEIAHLWSKANGNSPDDWINEGLAEFSALWASELVIGKPFSNLLLNEYHGIVDNTVCESSIIETSSNSWDREINRYYKPTLLLTELRNQYGDIKMLTFFRHLELAATQNGSLTTQMLLNVLGYTIGNEAQEFMRKALYSRPIILLKPSVAVLPNFDETLVGTWSGILNQFGNSTKFVLQIKRNENNLVATIDSPDQNAFNIPVNDFQIKEDVLEFKLNIASAGYKGTIDKEKLALTGVWTQRGAEYPLPLTKEKNNN